MPWVSWVSSLPTGNLGLLGLLGSVSLENRTHTRLSMAGLSREAAALTLHVAHSRAGGFMEGAAVQA